MVIEASQFAGQVRYIATNPGCDPRPLASTARAGKDLQLQSTIDMSAELRRTVHGYHQQPTVT